MERVLVPSLDYILSHACLLLEESVTSHQHLYSEF